MNTNTDNLYAAYIYWMHAAKPHSECELYVVAMADGHKVLTDDTMMMVTGCCKPRLFTSKQEAADTAEQMEYWMQEEGPVAMMAYDTFCTVQAARYGAAIRTVNVADAMAREVVAA